MRSLGILLLVLAPILSMAEETGRGSPTNRRMAITIDDLVVAQPSWHTAEQMERITDGLLSTFADHGVAAVGFVNQNKLEINGEVDAGRHALLQRWLSAGHELGNHGYAHLDLHRVSSEEWMADVVRGEPATKSMVTAAGGRLRWFRHPYLHTGMSVQVLEETAAFLSARGYIVAPVTIDNSEWVYGRAYAHAYNTGDEELMRRIGTDYVRYMLEVVTFYEAQSLAIVGRAIPHVLLVHAYALNADWLDQLLDALEQRGYRWVTLENALEDPAYENATHGWIGRGGITWLHRWAITEGLDRSIFKGEPVVPSWVESIQP
ncbi:MAG: polysaccharide deacetylase family protein [bacterium]|nr:polysaccharide deacetylase family protein [bacterium]